MGKLDYQLIDHTADLGVEVYGADLRSLFKNAALVLFELILSGQSPESAKPIEISLEAIDLPDLMVRWLSELLYIFEGEKRVVKDVEVVDIQDKNLYAQIYTIPYRDKYFQIENEIKAVTYHQLEIGRQDKRWYARIIFDL
ncbi:MAG TPA: archease [Desulfobacteraceae bacterium]|nr:archease [Desulfobacteraceae bacterium]